MEGGSDNAGLENTFFVSAFKDYQIFKYFYYTCHFAVSFYFSLI